MYIDWNGREQEDAEMDNMRADRREQERHQEQTPEGKSLCDRCGKLLDNDLLIGADMADLGDYDVLCSPCYGDVKREQREARRAAYWKTHDREKYSYIDNAAEAREQERQEREHPDDKPAPAPFRFCVHGCYALQYTDALESGGPGWYPLQWLDGAWRAYFSVGYFELTTLRFPTYQEGIEYLYSQP